MPIAPRSHRVPLPSSRSDLAPPVITELVLPEPIGRITGAVHRAVRPEQGRCNALWLLEAEEGAFALKVARGAYRGAELTAEHLVMQALHGLDVPVPESLLCYADDDLTWQLRPWAPGKPLRSLLKEPDLPLAERQAYLDGMACTLATIHGVAGAPDWTWEAWLESALRTAEANWRRGVFDPDDFGAADPGEVLAELQERRPAPGRICLLHGDYRTKNLLAAGGRITSVIDWAFADVGDPYYDLAIALGYASGPEEKGRFWRAYGLEPDGERLRYFKLLGYFLNV